MTRKKKIAIADNGAVADWYKRRYGQLDLGGLDLKGQNQMAGETITSNNHNQDWTLENAFNKNQAYTSDQDAVGQDIQSYYDSSYKGMSLDDYINNYNTNAAKIRGTWGYNLNGTPTSTQHTVNTQKGMRGHNQLFRAMFNNRSNVEGKSYGIGYQAGVKDGYDVEDTMGTSTWMRRMDQYEKEFEQLDDQEKLKRIHKINLGDGTQGYVYKKANGDIARLSPELIQQLHLNLGDWSEPEQEKPKTGFQAGIGMSNGLNEGDPEKPKKITEFIKNLSGKNPLGNNLGNIIALQRYFSNMRNNRRMLKESEMTIKPALKDPLIGHRYVYDGFNERVEGQRAANNVIRQAGKAKTSDASLNAAAQLEAQSQAEEIRAKANAQANAIQRDSKEKQWQFDQNLYQSNNGVWNFNNAALTEASNTLHKLRASKLNADQTNRNSLSMQMEQLARQKYADKKKRQDEFNQQMLQKEYEDLFENDPESARLKKLLSTPEVLNDENKFNEYYAQYVNRQKQLKSDYQQQYYDKYAHLYNLKNNYGNYFEQPKTSTTSAKPTWKTFSHKQGGILEMQNGGGMPPFTFYQPVMVNDVAPQAVTSPYATQQSAKASSSAEEKGKLTDKDLMSMLGQIDGLPSDMESVFNMMQRFYRLQQIDSSGVSSLSSAYLRALQSVKNATFNKKEFDKAYRVSSENDSLNETAITSDGHIVVMDNESGKIKPVTLSELNDNKNKYTEITNSQLLSYRAQVKANDNSIFDIVNNSISLTGINNMIHKYLGNIGTDEKSTSTYEQQKSKQVLDGLNVLQNISESGTYIQQGGLDGLYKRKIITETQKNQANRAISYIWDMLPKNAKVLLQLKHGDKAKDQIINFVTSGTSNKYSNDLDYVLDANGNNPGHKEKSGSGSSEPSRLSAAEAMILGYGASEPVQFNIGNSVSLTALARHNPLVSESGKPFEQGDSLQDLTGSQQTSVLDFGNATFGGAKLNNLGLQHTSIQNGDAICVEFPVDKQAVASGTIRPDFAMLKLIEEANTDIVRNKINDKDYEKINEIYQKHGLAPKFINIQGDWKLNSKEYTRFAVVYSNVDSRVIENEDDFDKKLVEEVDDDYSKERFEKLIKKKTDDKNYKMSNGFFGGETLYRGAVFIPIREDLLSASLTSPSSSQFKMQTNSAKEVDDLQQLSDIQMQTVQNYNKAPSLSTLQ